MSRPGWYQLAASPPPKLTSRGPLPALPRRSGPARTIGPTRTWFAGSSSVRPGRVVGADRSLHHAELEVGKPGRSLVAPPPGQRIEPGDREPVLAGQFDARAIDAGEQQIGARHPSADEFLELRPVRRAGEHLVPAVGSLGQLQCGPAAGEGQGVSACGQFLGNGHQLPGWAEREVLGGRDQPRHQRSGGNRLNGGVRTSMVSPQSRSAGRACTGSSSVDHAVSIAPRRLPASESRGIRGDSGQLYPRSSVARSLEVGELL